ncbi:MAG: hypothetical protein KAT70_06285, partial [Thermoplasmata archaeon]|nr:hypothetical protein [Thermoplasmata archaeon]
RFLFTNVPATPDTFTIPNGANNDEIKLIPLSCSDVGWIGGINGDATKDHQVTFTFTMEKQSWAMWTSFALAGPVGDPTTPGTGLDELFTWDIMGNIHGLTGGNESIYDEFGVYRYAEFTSTGLPGEFGGSGPPNSDIVLTPTGNAFANFSSNYNYSFGVYITDDMVGLINPVNTIDIDAWFDSGGVAGSQLAVEGGDFAGIDFLNHLDAYYFNEPGIADAIWLVGDGVGELPAVAIDAWNIPNDEGPNTVCGNGGLNPTWSANNGASNNPLSFQCRVGAGVLEDNYQGTLVFLLVQE